MELVIAVAGIVAVGLWLVVVRPSRFRSSLSVGILLMVVGVYFFLSGYWSSAIIGMGPGTPTVQRTSP